MIKIKLSKTIIMSFSVCYILLLILFLITSSIFAYTNINDKYIDIFVYVSLAISVFISSIILNKRLMKKGIIIGSIFGLSITLIIYLFSFLAIDTTMLNINMLYNIIISVLSGMLRWGVRC